MEYNQHLIVKQEYLYKLTYEGQYSSWVKYILIKENDMKNIKKYLSIHHLSVVYNDPFLNAEEVKTSSSYKKHKAIIKFLRKQNLMGDELLEDLKFACNNHDFKNCDGTIVNKCKCDWKCKCGAETKCEFECVPFKLNL